MLDKAVPILSTEEIPIATGLLPPKPIKPPEPPLNGPMYTFSPVTGSVTSKVPPPPIFWNGIAKVPIMKEIFCPIFPNSDPVNPSFLNWFTPLPIVINAIPAIVKAPAPTRIPAAVHGNILNPLATASNILTRPGLPLTGSIIFLPASYAFDITKRPAPIVINATPAITIAPAPNAINPATTGIPAAPNTRANPPTAAIIAPTLASGLSPNALEIIKTPTPIIIKAIPPTINAVAPPII